MKHQERFQEEKQACVQALLNRYWVDKATEPELFQAIRRHYQELREWFQEMCGFALILTRQFAKLEKIPGQAHSWMGFETFTHPRDYALFTYCLWYLEGKGESEQFLLTDMVEAIREHLLELGSHIDWTLYEHRLSMARALKQLKQMGVLVAVDGDEWEWALGGAERNVLYESSLYARYVLRRFPRELTTYTTCESLGEGMYPETPEGELKARKHRIFRRLLQEPVVYDDEWSEEERHYVLTQSHFILEQLERMAGLRGQRYREGLVFFYPEATGEMELFPTARAISDIVVALAGEIRRLRAGGQALTTDEKGCIQIPLVEFEGLLLKLRDKYGAYWSEQYRRATSAELAGELVQHLAEWGLGGWKGPNTVFLAPALARWNGEYSEEE
jgi:uncharacterized protein (TIGR02678 family)